MNAVANDNNKPISFKCTTSLGWTNCPRVENTAVNVGENCMGPIKLTVCLTSIVLTIVFVATNKVEVWNNVSGIFLALRIIMCPPHSDPVHDAKCVTWQHNKN